MNRRLLAGLLLLAALGIGACGQAAGDTAPTETTAPPGTADGAQAPPEAQAPSAQTMTGSGDPAVTAIMAKLELAGERFAAQGDPRAPLTVIEFSDYG